MYRHYQKLGILGASWDTQNNPTPWWTSLVVMIPRLGGLSGSHPQLSGRVFFLYLVVVPVVRVGMASWCSVFLICIGNLNAGNLLSSPNFPFFFAVMTIVLHQSVGVSIFYGSDDATFDIFSKGFSYLFLVVVRYQNKVMFGFRSRTFLEVNVSWKAGYCRNFSAIVKYCGLAAIVLACLHFHRLTEKEGS